MTIDEMLDKVAENLRLSSEPVSKKPASVRSGADCGERQGARAKGESAALGLKTAKLIARGVERAAEIIGVSVVTAIVNEGANIILLHSMDGAYIASARAAREKAYTAMALKMPTHTALEESRGGTLDGYVSGNGILLLGGGTPLERDGEIRGAIGVSGGTKEQDILLARVGAELFRAFGKGLFKEV